MRHNTAQIYANLLKKMNLIGTKCGANKNFIFLIFSNMVQVIELQFAAQISTSVTQCSTINENRKFKKCGSKFTLLARGASA